MTTKADLIKRTKQFALRVIRLTSALPQDMAGHVLGKQLLRSGTSVGANYRAACRGRSTKDFIAKMGIVEEEADESAFWLELIIEAGVMPKAHIEPLLNEANELTAIAVASRKTARARNRTPRDSKANP